MDLRKEELKCWKNFKIHFSQRLGINLSNWEKGEDPPDCYISLNKERFAVEITTVMSKVILPNKVLSERGYLSSVHKFIEEIEHKAKNEGILDGAYVISYFGPFHSLNKAKKTIENSALKYIKENQGVEQQKCLYIYKEDDRNCSIIKAGTASKKIGKGIGSRDLSNRWTEKALGEACRLLKECCHTKIKKLKNTTHPIILLLSNAFTHSDLFNKIFKMCKLDADIKNFYHSIFISEPDGSGYFVHSKVQDWL